MENDRLFDGSVTPSRRRKAPPSEKPAPFPPLAAKANDLESLKKTVEDAAAVSGGLWLSYLFVMFYTAVAAGAVTHTDLLLENAVKLPFLGVELPLKAFFVLAPIIFIISHAYTLAHFELLANKAARFHDALYAQIPGELPQNPTTVEKRDGLRRQLPSNIFVQFMAGPKEIREGWFGFLLKVIAWTTLVIGPVLLLILLQMQFLPYHAYWITWVHRLALVIDLGLIWWLWRSILSARETSGSISWPRIVKKVAFSGLWLALGGSAVFFSWIVATTPWEFEEGAGPLAYVGALVPKDLNLRLFDSTKGSWFANTLVLQDFNLNRALKIDDPERIKGRDYLLILRGRDLNNADFTRAVLERVDFESAWLQSAIFDHAHLHGSRFNDAKLYRAEFKTFAGILDNQPTDFSDAQLEDVSFDYAHLRWARFKKAHLQGAIFSGADLRDTDFYMANLKGAKLEYARLEGASMGGANLQGAELEGASLKGADLNQAQLQGANLGHAYIKDANLRGANVEGAVLGGAPKPAANGAGAISLDAASNNRALAKFLGDLVCETEDDDIYILRGLAANGRLLSVGLEAPPLLDRFRSADCPVSVRLTDDYKAKLHMISKKAVEQAAKAGKEAKDTAAKVVLPPPTPIRASTKRSLTP